MSQNEAAERYRGVDAHSDTILVSAQVDTDLEFDATFEMHFARIARVVTRVVRDRGRAEELAVDVFIKWWKHTEARGERAAGWLSRTAVRVALDELRRDVRRRRNERLISALRFSPKTPEDISASTGEQQRVRAVLARLSRRDAALLVLRSEGSSYDELAAALALNPSSIGTFISRAQRAFRAEYVRHYGEH